MRELADILKIPPHHDKAMLLQVRLVIARLRCGMWKSEMQIFVNDYFSAWNHLFFNQRKRLISLAKRFNPLTFLYLERVAAVSELLNPRNESNSQVRFLGYEACFRLLLKQLEGINLLCRPLSMCSGSWLHHVTSRSSTGRMLPQRLELPMLPFSSVSLSDSILAVRLFDNFYWF